MEFSWAQFWRKCRDSVDGAAFDAIARIITSPRLGENNASRQRPFSGWPAKRERKCSLHATLKPTLLGWKGNRLDAARAGVRARSIGAKPGQLAPPSARRVTAGSIASPPFSLEANGAVFSPSEPSCAGFDSTPWLLRRVSQARRSGEAFIAFGNAAAGADEGLGTKAVGPVDEVACCEGLQHRQQMAGGFARSARMKRSVRS